MYIAERRVSLSAPDNVLVQCTGTIYRFYVLVQCIGSMYWYNVRYHKVP